ncbi:MAG: flagellar protein FliT [Rhodocyclaceae bacterium]|nr:flagellar protein FliT [Rhodocyclaceae bacterium]
MNVIGMYETMGEISTRMVEAAQANDWDRLVELEKNVAHLRDVLRQEDHPLSLSSEERARKLRLIHRILDADAEVRRHTEPWMAQVRVFLGSVARERKIRQTYGSN